MVVRRHQNRLNSLRAREFPSVEQFFSKNRLVCKLSNFVNNVVNLISRIHQSCKSCYDVDELGLKQSEMPLNKKIFPME